mmetsp:Transcript_103764/g.288936  ORF Transcript_103764/g.288936 Transcript_103764/m.288936 type:complete len:267 (-) Transcript_103764:331-1131(-)
MDAKRLALHPHLLVQERAIKLCAEVLCMLGVGEAQEPIADIDTLLEVEWKVKEIVQTFEPAPVHFLEEHQLRELPWDLPDHHSDHALIPGHGVQARALPAVCLCGLPWKPRVGLGICVSKDAAGAILRRPLPPIAGEHGGLPTGRAAVGGGARVRRGRACGLPVAPNQRRRRKWWASRRLQALVVAGVPEVLLVGPVSAGETVVLAESGHLPRAGLPRADRGGLPQPVAIAAQGEVDLVHGLNIIRVLAVHGSRGTVLPKTRGKPA